MYQVLIVLHVLIAIAIVVLVLLQQGKGADMGAAFGSGASGTLFGARGSASFLSRTTAILAALFFLNSLALAYFSGASDSKNKDFIEFLKSANDLPPAKNEKPVSDAPEVAPAETLPEEPKK
ncbi:MAG: preprotein translocase subunit SecG [Methylohalobius sp.]